VCPDCEHLVVPIRPTRLLSVLTTPSERPRQERDAADHPASHQALHGLNVLVVEDNPINQTFARLLLDKLGAQVTIAGDGEQGLVHLARDTFDLVLSDVQMPVIDGLTMTRTIREREAGTGEHLPIIGVTAHALRADRDRCLEAGMDAYVSKPIKASELLTAIENVRAGASAPLEPVST
jgi:CheY-like chemotaxis protein